MGAHLKGYLAITAAAVLWGLAGAAVKHMFVARGADPITLVQFRMTLSGLITGVALAGSRPGLLRVKRSAGPLLALYGIGGLSLAQVAYYWAIREGNVATAVFLQYLAPLLTALYETVITATLEPVCASIWAFVLLGEALSPVQVGGCVLVLGAVVTLQTLPGAIFVDTPSEPEGSLKEEVASHG